MTQQPNLRSTARTIANQVGVHDWDMGVLQLESGELIEVIHGSSQNASYGGAHIFIECVAFPRVIINTQKLGEHLLDRFALGSWAWRTMKRVTFRFKMLDRLVGKDIAPRIIAVVGQGPDIPDLPFQRTDEVWN